MSYQALLEEISGRINDAVSREGWEDARLGLREFARILVDATVAGDSELVAKIDEFLAQVFTDLSFDDAFLPDLTVTALGWSTDGLRDVAQLARARRPPMTSEQRSVSLRDAETRIIALLGEGNRPPLSNRDIASALQLNVATVARTLAGLRKAKKVKSWPEGRLMMNELVMSSNTGSVQEAGNTRLLEALHESSGIAPRERKLSLPQNITKNIGNVAQVLKPVPLDIFSLGAKARVDEKQILQESESVVIPQVVSTMKNLFDVVQPDGHRTPDIDADFVSDLFQVDVNDDKLCLSNPTPVLSELFRHSNHELSWGTT